MSKDEESIFFGGLPPRQQFDESTTSGESGRNPRRVPRRVPVVVVGTLSAVLIIAAALALPQLSGPAGDTPDVAPMATLSAQEQAAIDAGGGAVPGHIASAELCDAVEAVAAIDSTADAAEDGSSQLLGALEVLASVESPYQAKYQAYHAWSADPTTVTSEREAQTIMTEFTEAMQIDVMTCA